MPPSMIPFQGSVTLQAPSSFAQKGIIAINVGGTIFNTSASSLRRADQGSILASLLNTPSIPLKSENPPFFDRDPDLFAALLSILRTSRKTASIDDLFSVNDLIGEAEYYGVTGALKSAMTVPSLDGLDMTEKSVLLPSGRDFPSALSVDRADGSVIVSHGSKMSIYDWGLRSVEWEKTNKKCPGRSFWRDNISNLPGRGFGAVDIQISAPHFFALFGAGGSCPTSTTVMGAVFMLLTLHFGRPPLFQTMGAVLHSPT